ncbi:MAG: SDR family NAD(P)-dependent oxidoreductase [Hymenobacteraceae bacterium]|nr:SDR family NAD(P)-dependent oxidoreductase [Hymenobacteraceae bacterium]
MHYYFITGTSRGLGRALAEAFLEVPDTTVVGIARHATIQHPHYHHHSLDLADLAAVERYLPRLFAPFGDARSLTLLNNAGILGQIAYVGQVPASHFAPVFNVNVLAPAVLLNAFLATYAARGVPLVALNISSGAAQRPIDGWAAYCASKAALDMLTRTAAAEQALVGHDHVRLYALAPGVVDTAMQAQIRMVGPAAFSQVDQFRALHDSGELASPEAVAQRIRAFLQSPVRHPSGVLHLRDLP